MRGLATALRVPSWGYPCLGSGVRPDLNSQNVLRRAWLLFLLSFSGQERHSGPKCSATFSPVSDFDQPLGRVNVVHNRRSSPSSAHSARPGQAYVASMEAGRADSKLLKRV